MMKSGAGVNIWGFIVTDIVTQYLVPVVYWFW